jgi:hypothetical protein
MGECSCSDDFDDDELGVDPEATDTSSSSWWNTQSVEKQLRRKGRRYPGEIVED